MKMHNPMHPGEYLKEMCFDPIELEITEAAKLLNVSRSALSRLLNGKANVSVEMAFKLEKAFNGTAQSWLNMQTQYDVWLAQQDKGLMKELRAIKKIA